MTFSDGVYTALVTPMKEGQVNYEVLEQLVDRQIQAGVAGLIICGSTGEGSLLTPCEKLEMTHVVAARVNKRIPVFVGSSDVEAFPHVDGFLIMTPPGLKPTQEGIFGYFEDIANRTDLPLIAYNHPGRAAVNIEPKTLKRLSEIPNVVAIKEASESMMQVMETIALQPKIPIFSGNDPFTLPMIGCGANGAISIASNLYPKEMVEMVNFMLQGEVERAHEMHYRFLPFFNFLSIETNPIPIKWALQDQGLDVGEPRAPLTPLKSVFTLVDLH